MRVSNRIRQDRKCTRIDSDRFGKYAKLVIFYNRMFDASTRLLIPILAVKVQ